MMLAAARFTMGRVAVGGLLCGTALTSSVWADQTFPAAPPAPSVLFSNASLREPPSSLHVKDASSDINTRLAELGRISSTPLVLFPTETHKDLAAFVLHHLNGLARPQGFPTNGVHGRTLLGAKGIGKSTLLRHIVEVSEVLHPNVVAAYVTCTDSSTEHLLLPVARHLVEIGVIDHLRSVEDAVEQSKLHDLIMEALHSKGKKLLLVVDEMDQLYRCVPNDPVTFVAARRSLSSLASLGDRGGSVCAVLLCGSSSVLPLLITANGSRNHGIVSEYPTVRGAPNLNGQKYSVVRVPGGLPSDLDTALAVCRSLGDDCESQARLALFIAGSTPRLLQSAHTSSSLKNVEQAVDSSMSSHALSGRSRAFYEAVMADLRDANADLMKSVLKDGVVSVELVATVPWETKFKPLSHHHLAKLWRRVCSEHPASAGTDDLEPMEPTLQSEILRLCDKGFLAQDASKTDHGMPNAVYPVSAVSLFKHETDPLSSWDSFVAVFDSDAKTLRKTLVRGVGNAAAPSLASYLSSWFSYVWEKAFGKR